MCPDPGTQARLSPRVLEQAADWMMRLHDDSSASLSAQWQRWHDADPEHARAWQRARHLLALTAQVPGPLARSVLQAPASRGRRALLRSVATLLVAPIGGWLAWRLWEDAAWDASVRTAVGERRQHLLPDGSVLHLDTDTAVDIAFDAVQRLLRLRHGQVLLITAVDPQSSTRPFVLASPAGRMQALGTRFNVLHQQATSVLGVTDGAVQVTLAAEGSSRRIVAGRQVRFTAEAFEPTVPAEPAIDAWQQGMLVVDALPLRMVLARLGRYQHGGLGCDDAIATLPVSGAFPVDDPDRSLSMLAGTYNLQIRRGPAGLWTRLHPARAH
ncbi:FecR domain-containing protein [Stenotrophomonas lactitubi]